MKLRILFLALLGLIAFSDVNAQTPIGGFGVTRTAGAPTWTRAAGDSQFSWDETNSKLYYQVGAGSAWTEFVQGGTTLYSGNGTIADATRTVTFTNGTTTDLIFTDATNTLMTLTDAGTTGTLAVTGDISAGLDLTVTGNDITFGNAETISNATDGTILLTSPIVTTSANLQVTGDLTVSGGDVITANAAVQWTAIDNNAAGVQFGSTGHLDLLTMITTDGGEGMAIDAPVGVTYNPHGTGAGNTSEIRFAELAAGGANYTGFKAADAMVGNVIYTLPDADATVSGQVLSSDASGALSWVSAAANTNFFSDDLTQTVARTHTLLDNTATAVTLDAAGLTGIFAITTTDGAEGISTSGDMTVGDALTVTGVATMNGNVILGDAATDGLTIASDDIILSNIQTFANMTAADAALAANTIWAANGTNTMGYQEGTLMISLN